jgi:hypothetical protein
VKGKFKTCFLIQINTLKVNQTLECKLKPIFNLQEEDKLTQNLAPCSSSGPEEDNILLQDFYSLHPVR